MGMDVKGKDPSGEAGEYFRNNVWYWRPLWDYCLFVAPKTAGKCEGHYNDGEGLGSEDSEDLAQILRKSVADNKHLIFLDAMPEKYGEEIENFIKRFPLPEGFRPARNIKKMRDAYHFSKENVLKFADFLEESGGFEIW